MPSPDGSSGMRLDKWLWAARFYKTRQDAVEAIKGGHVHFDGHVQEPVEQHGTLVGHADRLVHVGAKLAVGHQLLERFGAAELLGRAVETGPAVTPLVAVCAMLLSSISVIGNTLMLVRKHSR